MNNDSALLNPLCNRKKSLRTLIGFISLLAVFLFGSAVLNRANAASTIDVTTTADEYGTGTGCSLREAIKASNTNLPFGGCAAGSGPLDTINLPAGTYPLTIDGVDSGDGADNSLGDLDITEVVIIAGLDQVPPSLRAAPISMIASCTSPPQLERTSPGCAFAMASRQLLVGD